MRKHGKRNGMAVIFVVGMLALLSILGAVFVETTTVDRSLGATAVQRTRALLAAESGVAYAIRRVQDFSGVLSPEQWADMQYMEVNPGADWLTMPRASFQAAGVAGPRSGTVSGTYATDGDYYILRVEDESGKLNLNDTNGKWNMDTDPYVDDPATDPDLTGAPGRLESVIADLASRLFGAAAGNEAGKQLFHPAYPHSCPNQPGGVFASMEKVREALVGTGALTESQYREFRRHVTLHSWQDPDTLRPSFQLSIENPAAQAAYPHRGFDVYLFRDFQTGGFELEPRCPVNVNAASPELLAALIAPVRGWYLREGPGERVSNGRYGAYSIAPLKFNDDDRMVFGPQNSGNGPVTSGPAPYAPSGQLENVSPFSRVMFGFQFDKNNILGMARQTPVVKDPAGLAMHLWERVHGADGQGGLPFRTWEEFEHYLRYEADRNFIIPADGYLGEMNDNAEQRVLRHGPNGLNFGGQAIPVGQGGDRFNSGSSPERLAWWREYFYQIHVDALLANFNPNAQIADYTPNRTTHKQVDKAHLTQYTAELCFEPTGVFHVESLGVVSGAQGAPLARATVDATVRAFYTLRRTTQRHFLGEPATAMDQQHCFPHSPVAPTAGADFNTGFNGFVFQSYPEPIREGAVKPYLSPYDGSWMLATLQNHDAQATYHHHAAGSIRPRKEDCQTQNDSLFLVGTEDLPVMDRNAPTETLLTPAAADILTHPGNVYPDGFYSEAGRTVTTPWDNIGGDDGKIGTLAFWIKPNFHPGITSRPHKLLSLHARTLRRLFSGDPVQQPHLGEFCLMYFCHDFNRLPLRQPISNYGFNVLRNDLLSDVFIPGMGGTSWLATRAFVCGYGGLRPDDNPTTLPVNAKANVWAMASQTACHDYPAPAPDSAAPGHFDFEGNVWNHVALSWNTSILTVPMGYYEQEGVGDQTGTPEVGQNGNTPPVLTVNGSAFALQKINFGINGQPVGGDYVMGSQMDIGALDDKFHNDQVEHPFWGQTGVNAHVRFGEVTGGGTEFNQREAFSADAVYDEILAWPSPSIDTALSLFNDGRYYNGSYDDMIYTSPATDVHRTLGIGRAEALRLRSVSWTAYWPKTNRAGMALQANFPGVDVNPAVDPMDAFWNNGALAGQGIDPVCVDFSVGNAADATWRFLNAADYDPAAARAAMPAYAPGVDIRSALRAAGMSAAEAVIRPGEEFRYRVYLNAGETGIPFYESPVFDDITFTFTGGGPEILHWSAR